MKKYIFKYIDFIWRDNKVHDKPEDISFNVALSKVKYFIELLAEPNIDKMIEEINSKIELTEKRKELAATAFSKEKFSSYIEGLNDALSVINDNKNTAMGEFVMKILTDGIK